MLDKEVSIGKDSSTGLHRVSATCFCGEIVDIYFADYADALELEGAIKKATSVVVMD